MNPEELAKLSVETRCVQAGYQPGNHDARIMPIVQSTTYKFDSADDLGDVFDLEVDAPMYTRLGNPSLNWLEDKVNALEGGVGALSTSSGQAANWFAIVNLCQAGDHVLAMNNLYGGTHTLFGSQLARFGIEVEFVDAKAPLETLKKHIRPNTKAIFGESLGNPSLEVMDFAKMRALADAAQAPLVVDNTFPTPVLCRPFEYGADIITHSTTKYLDGHATSVGGMIVDGGRFEWKGEKWRQFNEPDEDYHGLVYTEAFGPAAFIARARAGLLRDFGATMSPFNAFLTNLGIETLHLRMERHSENALKVATFLENHPKVSWVHYPKLKSDSNYELAEKYLPNGASGVVSFGVKGGAKEAKTVCDSVKLATLVIHVGDLRSHLLHPASTTHRQLSDEQLIKSGVLPELIRFNVGIENIDDILNDLDQALNQLP